MWATRFIIVDEKLFEGYYGEKKSKIFIKDDFF